MADLLTAEVMDILKDKYLFNNIPTKFFDFDNGTLINIYLRMITVIDDANDISHLDSPFDRTQELTHESRLFFLKHIIRCIRPLECSYCAPKTSSLLDKKRALRILTSLYEEAIKKHGKGLPQRIRAVIKKEEIRNKNLIKKTSKVNGATLMTNDKEINEEKANAENFFKINSESERTNATFTPVKSSIGIVIIPEGRQIPRTPLKLDPIEKNIKEQELMPPPPEFCSPTIGVALAAPCLSPPKEFSDVRGSCLPILPLFSPPEEFKDNSEGNNNVDTSSVRSHSTDSPKFVFDNSTNSPMKPPAFRNVASAHLIMKNTPEDSGIPSKKCNKENLMEVAIFQQKHNDQRIMNDLLNFKAPVIVDPKFKHKEKDTIQNTGGSFVDKKFSPVKIIRNTIYDQMKTHQHLSDVAPLRFMDDENNQPVTYFHGDALESRETYDIVPNPLKSRETFVVSQPLKSRETFVVSQPLKSRETFVVSQSLKCEETSICSSDAENEQHRESDQSEINGSNNNIDDDGSLSQSPDSNCNQSQIYQKVKDNCIVTVKQENGKETLIKKTVISPDLVSTTVTEINYTKNKAIRHFPKGKELLRTPPSSDSSFCSKSLNLDRSLNLSKNDLLVQIYISKKDADNLQHKKNDSLESKSHESVSELKRLVNYSVESNSSTESNSLAIDNESVGTNSFKMTESGNMKVCEVKGGGMSFEHNCQKLDIDTRKSEIADELCQKKSDFTNTKHLVSAIKLDTNMSHNLSCEIETLQSSDNFSVDDDSFNIFPCKKITGNKVDLKKCGKSILNDAKGSDLNHTSDVPSNESLEKKTLIMESLILVKENAGKEEESMVESPKQIEQMDVSKGTRNAKKLSAGAKENDAAGRSNELKNIKFKNQGATLEKIVELTNDFDSLKSIGNVTDATVTDCNERKCKGRALRKKIKIKEEVSKKAIKDGPKLELKDNLTAMECEEKNICPDKENPVSKEVASSIPKSESSKTAPFVNEIDINDINLNKTKSQGQQLKCYTNEFIKNVSEVNKVKISRRGKTKSFKTDCTASNGNKNENNVKSASNKIKAAECERKNKKDENKLEVNSDEPNNEEEGKLTSLSNLKTTTYVKLDKTFASECPLENSPIPDINTIIMKEHKVDKLSEIASKPNIKNKKKSNKKVGIKCTTTEIPKEREMKMVMDDHQCPADDKCQDDGDEEEVIGKVNCEMKTNIKGKKSNNKKVTNRVQVMRKEISIKPKSIQCNKDSEVEGEKQTNFKASKNERSGDYENNVDEENNENGTIDKIMKEDEEENVKNHGQCLAVGNREVSDKEYIGKAHCKTKVHVKGKKRNVKKVTSKEVAIKPICDKDMDNEIEGKDQNGMKTSKSRRKIDCKDKMEKGMNRSSIKKILKDQGEDYVQDSSQCLAVGNTEIGREKEEVIEKEADEKDKFSRMKKMVKPLKISNKESNGKRENVVLETKVKRQSKAKLPKSKLANLKTDSAIDNLDNIKIKRSHKNEKKGQTVNENSFENCNLLTEKLIHCRSPLQVINACARPSRRCKTKASEAISKALNDSLC